MDAMLGYRSIAYNNGWANHRLLTACAVLSQRAVWSPADLARFEAQERTKWGPIIKATDLKGG